MTVLGALLLEPGPVKAHEVAKSSDVRIPRMLHKSGNTGRQQFRKGFFARLIESTGQ